MRILLTNDDGITAVGIKAQAKALSRFAEVICVAPLNEQSGTGHGITVRKPLRVSRLAREHFPDAKTAWAVDGTPADCVKLALDKLLPEDEQPDIVVSGVNCGGNLGTDVVYSGTVSGALEGYINDISAIAVSLVQGGDDFDYAAEFVARFCREHSSYLAVRPKILNINIPNLLPRQIKGVKLCKLGERRYLNPFSKISEPNGQSYFMLGGEIDDSRKAAKTDIEAIAEGYITITPLSWDLTNYSDLAELSNLQF